MGSYPRTAMCGDYGLELLQADQRPQQGLAAMGGPAPPPPRRSLGLMRSTGLGVQDSDLPLNHSPIKAHMTALSRQHLYGSRQQDPPLNVEEEVAIA